jgi:Ca-activated chloride channel family protein
VDHFSIVTNVVRSSLVCVADWLCGCRHQRTAHPITLRGETYVVCFECGAHLPYDLTKMRINRRSLMVVPLLLFTGFGADARLQAAQPFALSVNVDYVVLHAKVHDQKGQVVTDLHEQDFEVHEDGIRQPVRMFRNEDTAVTIGLVIDHSGSMRPKLAEVIAGARAFVRASNPDDELFVVNFNENVTFGLIDPMRFTNRIEELEAAIRRTPADGMTALYDAVAKALQHLGKGNREKKVLIVISDGGDNASTHNLAKVLQIAGQSNVLVYTLGVFAPDDPDRNPDVLRRLAQATGGEAFFPKQLNEVVASCEQIARDIRQQYTLAYVPSREARPGSYRRVQVIARAAGYRKLVVRTRSGYFRPEAERNERIK